MSPLTELITGAKAYGWGSFNIKTSFESIATSIVGVSGSSSILFSSIPSTYAHLQLRIFDVAGTLSDSGYSGINFNGDTLNNYTRHQLYGNATSALAYGESGSAKIFYPSSRSTSIISTSIVDIFDYANTNKYKTVRLIGGLNTNGGSGQIITITSGVWMNTNAITSITLTPYAQYQQYSHFALYGIKGA